MMLYLVAWIAVPVAFLTYIHFAYSVGLVDGRLPFLGSEGWKWWLAFVVSILAGATCIALARKRNGINRILWLVLYIVAMGVLLIGAHLTVACSRGDCL